MLSPIATLFKATSRPAQSHFYMMDLLRGMAAFSILFWHYQHFLALGTAAASSRASYPLYWLFWPLYEFGGTAVQLFWIISGFVFATVYHDVAEVTRAFVVHRVARLYPLHVVTLLVVALLQYVARSEFGHSLIYHHNSLGNFGVQLGMASGWGLTDMFTFNGPVWSVSAEVLVYALFWAAHRQLFSAGIVKPLALTAGLLVMAVAKANQVLLCGSYFFLGTSLYATHSAFERRAALKSLAIATSAIGAVICFVRGWDGPGFAALFVALTLGAAAAENSAVLRRWAKRVPWLADNTYGSYLWHVPVQLTLLLLLHHFRIGRSVAYATWYLLLYLTLVTVTARVSFLCIERPARRAIRRRFEKCAT